MKAKVNYDAKNVEALALSKCLKTFVERRQEKTISKLAADFVIRPSILVAKDICDMQMK